MTAELSLAQRSSLPDAQNENPCVRSLPQITAEARRYAVKELARRAGVSRDFFDTWRIEVLTDSTVISLPGESRRTLRFVHGEQSSSSGLNTDDIPVARAGWPDESRAVQTEKDLILPFCASETDDRQPLYFFPDREAAICRLDLLSSFLLTLSRFEETLCSTLDQHNRFPARASVAFRHGFLHRPILDEHGIALEQVLSAMLPGWKPEPRILRVKLTHDVDDVGIPFRLRNAFGHTLKRRNVSATIRDLIASCTPTEPTELSLVRYLGAISQERGLHSTFYWKSAPSGAFDSGYNPRDPKLQKVIESLRNVGFEMGVHPGYDTFRDRAALASEVEYLRQALKTGSLGGRQHYLRWSPNTWLDWETCRLLYDSSVGFADALGFRAGTAFPYRPWSLREDRELNLIELPLILMDCAPVKYLKLRHHDGLVKIEDLIKRVARTGGVFTLLWHNTPLLDPDYDGWYPAVLDMLEGAEGYQLSDQVEDLW